MLVAGFMSVSRPMLVAGFLRAQRHDCVCIAPTGPSRQLTSCLFWGAGGDADSAVRRVGPRPKTSPYSDAKSGVRRVGPRPKTPPYSDANSGVRRVGPRPKTSPFDMSPRRASECITSPISTPICRPNWVAHGR